MKRRINKERLGETKVDTGGRSYISTPETEALRVQQLRVTSPKRNRQPPKRLSPAPINKRPTKRKR